MREGPHEFCISLCSPLSLTSRSCHRHNYMNRCRRCPKRPISWPITMWAVHGRWNAKFWASQKTLNSASDELFLKVCNYQRSTTNSTMIICSPTMNRHLALVWYISDPQWYRQLDVTEQSCYIYDLFVNISPLKKPVEEQETLQTVKMQTDTKLTVGIRQCWNLKGA